MKILKSIIDCESTTELSSEIYVLLLKQQQKQQQSFRIEEKKKVFTFLH